MTFWDMFNAHPIYGFFLAAGTVICVSQALIGIMSMWTNALTAKWSACDCEPCDLEHVDEQPTCGIASGIHADDELCTLPEAHDGACSHGIPRDA